MIDKNTSISIGVLIVLIPVIAFITSRAGKSDVEVMKDRIVENEKIDLKQTILIDNATKTLERINKKLEE